MKRTLLLVGVALVSLISAPMVARAASPQTSAVAMLLGATRPGGELALFLRLNGTPVRKGVIVSAAGASTTNSSTATPFTITSGDVYEVVCDAAAFCIEGATASATYTAAAFGVPIPAAGSRFYVFAAGTSTTTLACAGAAAFNCAAFRME